MLAKLNFTTGFAGGAQPLPLPQALALHDALQTVHCVIAGLRCQPRFDRDDSSSRDNEAGEELEDLAEMIGRRMDELVGVIRASYPPEGHYRDARMVFLLRHEIGSDDAITDVAGAAARAVFQDQF